MNLRLRELFVEWDVDGTRKKWDGSYKGFAQAVFNSCCRFLTRHGFWDIDDIQTLFFRHFVHTTGTLRSYLIVVGIGHIWHKENGHRYMSAHMYQIHVPVWYKCFLVHAISPFFSECIPEFHLNTSNADVFLWFVSDVLVGSCGGRKHSRFRFMELVGTLTKNVSPYLWVYAWPIGTLRCWYTLVQRSVHYCMYTNWGLRPYMTPLKKRWHWLAMRLALQGFHGGTDFENWPQSWEIGRPKSKTLYCVD